jgi:hypothetical protein
VLGVPIQPVFIRVHPWLKTKTPPPVLAMGFDKSLNAIRTQPPRYATAARSAAGSDSNCDSRGKNSGASGKGQIIKMRGDDLAKIAN